jgi:hypothetical protein
MRHHTGHVRRLGEEAHARFKRLVDVFPACGPGCAPDTVMVNGSKVRIAVDDFKTILAEIRRLK